MNQLKPHPWLLKSGCFLLALFFLPASPADAAQRKKPASAPPYYPVFHVERGERGKQVNLSALAKKLCTEEEQFALPFNGTLTVVFSPDSKIYAKDLARLYQGIYLETEKNIGYPPLPNMRCYLFRYGEGGLPPAFLFEEAAPPPDTFVQFAVLAPESSDEKAGEDMKECLSFNLAWYCHNSLPMVASDKAGHLWFFEGVQDWLQDRLKRFLKNEKSDIFRQEACEAFDEKALRDALWTWKKAPQYVSSFEDLAGQSEKTNAFYRENARLEKAAYGAFLWMEEKGGEDAVPRILKSLYDACSVKKRQATKREIFKTIKAVCGEDIRRVR